MEETLDKLVGEDDIETITRTRKRRVCEICGEPAHYRVTFLLLHARSNMDSKAFGRDDCSFCADAELFACREHQEEVESHPPEGMSYCSTFSASARFAHMFLYWVNQ